jgi:hypothetical protein
LDYSDYQLPGCEDALDLYLGASAAHRLPELRGPTEAQGVVRPVFGSRPPPFFPEDPPCPPALDPIYLLDPVFFLFYTLPSRKQLLIQKRIRKWKKRRLRRKRGKGMEDGSKKREET